MRFCVNIYTQNKKKYTKPYIYKKKLQCVKQPSGLKERGSSWSRILLKKAMKYSTYKNNNTILFKTAPKLY